MYFREVGIVVISEFGYVCIILLSYDKIEELININEVFVIFGFFGVIKEN